MKATAINISELIKADKWRADLYVHFDSEIKSEKFNLMPLRDVVLELKVAKDPSEEQGGFYYIGLENVEPITGEPQGISITTSENVRSRSKVFKQGNILYGRLRPYLKKAFVVEEPYTSGLCSTEFIVVEAKPEFILPLFLREILVSQAFTELVTRLQAGSALPRVSSKDLLNIAIPVPPLSFQKELVSKLEYLKKQRRYLTSKISNLTEEGQALIKEVFT